MIPRRVSSALLRRSKKQPVAAAAECSDGWYDRQGSPDSRSVVRRYAGVPGVRGAPGRCVASCGKVKRERLEFLADNPFYTKRFAYYVGRRCRSATIKDVAKELKLDWHTVKELDKQYMKAQLAKAGKPGPKVIGIDEISIRKGHTYRIVVSDLCASSTDLVWRRGPLGGEHERVLRLSWAKPEERAYSPWR